MEAKLIINGCEIKVGIELLTKFTHSLPDDESMNDIFHVLATSDSENIRGFIAYQDTISVETALLLLNDASDLVLSRIVRNQIAKTVIDKDILERIISRGNDATLEEIGLNFHDYEKVSPEFTINKLLEKGSLISILSIAGNYDTPSKFLKQLTHHSDPDISRTAKNTLAP